MNSNLPSHSGSAINQPFGQGQVTVPPGGGQFGNANALLNIVDLNGVVVIDKVEVVLARASEAKYSIEFQTNNRTSIATLKENRPIGNRVSWIEKIALPFEEFTCTLYKHRLWKEPEIIIKTEPVTLGRIMAVLKENKDGKVEMEIQDGIQIKIYVDKKPLDKYMEQIKPSTMLAKLEGVRPTLELLLELAKPFGELHVTAKVVLGCFDAIWKQLLKDEVFIERLHTLFEDISQMAPLLLKAAGLKLDQTIRSIVKDFLSLLHIVFKQIEHINNLTILDRIFQTNEVFRNFKIGLKRNHLHQYFGLVAQLGLGKAHWL